MGRKADHPLSIAIRVERTARRRWREHQRGCYRCHRAVLDVRYGLCCDAGWELAKAASKAAVDLCKARDVEHGQADTQQQVMF